MLVRVGATSLYIFVSFVRLLVNMSYSNMTVIANYCNQIQSYLTTMSQPLKFVNNSDSLEICARADGGFEVIVFTYNRTEGGIRTDRTVLRFSRDEVPRFLTFLEGATALVNRQ